jgi:hypothetical protein
VKRAEEKVGARDPLVELAPTISVLQGVVTKELCDEVFYEVRDRERQRKLALHALYWFWTSVVLRAPRSLTLAFQQAGLAVDPFAPAMQATLSSFFERCKNLQPGFFMAIYHRVVHALEKQGTGSYCASYSYLKQRFTSVQIIDGSRCDKIAHRLKVLRNVRAVVLPGCLTAVYDLFRGYATDLYYWKDAALSEFKRAMDVVETLAAGTLLLGDRLYCSIQLFSHLRALECYGLFRYNKSIKYRRLERLSVESFAGGRLEDNLVEIGRGAKQQKVRLIRLKVNGKTYAAMTNVLDPALLSAQEVAKLYPLRWKIERLFYTLKVVLNLKEFYAANPNAVAMQIYAAAAVHATFRVVQGITAEKLGVTPEEISTEKLFPRLAMAAYVLAMRDILHHEYQRQVPDSKLRKPSLKKFGFTQARLSEIRVETRTGKRRKRRYCKSRATWTSLRKIAGASALLN